MNHSITRGMLLALVSIAAGLVPAAAQLLDHTHVYYSGGPQPYPQTTETHPTRSRVSLPGFWGDAHLAAGSLSAGIASVPHVVGNNLVVGFNLVRVRINGPANVTVGMSMKFDASCDVEQHPGDTAGYGFGVSFELHPMTGYASQAGLGASRTKNDSVDQFSVNPGAGTANGGVTTVITASPTYVSAILTAQMQTNADYFIYAGIRTDAVGTYGGSAFVFSQGNIQLSAALAPGYTLVTDGAVALDPRADPPAISRQPDGRTVTAGNPAEMSVAASGTAPLSYQWHQNGFPVPGATGSAYTLPSAQLFHTGNYMVAVTDSAGATTFSVPGRLAVVPALASNARLSNLSTRALSLTGDQVLIPGFVISGTANKRLLIRAVGPTLGMAPFNLPGVLANPRMALKRYDTSLVPPAFVDVANNDDWITNANAADITTTGAQLFAFGLQSNLDAALLVDLAPGQYTVVTDGVSGGTGTAIVELYDADPASPAPGSRLINISNRGFAGVGGEIMIPGFVVSAEGPKTVLLRVVGPTLAQPPFNVSGTMADPLLRVYRAESNGTSTLLFTNNDWGTVPDPAATVTIAQQVSAFPLATGSQDAALVLTLAPGVYTVHGAAADGTSTGVVLVEVYVVP